MKAGKLENLMVVMKERHWAEHLDVTKVAKKVVRWDKSKVECLANLKAAMMDELMVVMKEMKLADNSDLLLVDLRVD